MVDAMVVHLVPKKALGWVGSMVAAMAGMKAVPRVPSSVFWSVVW